MTLASSPTAEREHLGPNTRTAGILGRYAFFGAVLAFAGPPIYIHTPSLYANQHGMSLAAIGVILLGLRLFDFVQDPLLGRWIAKTAMPRRSVVLIFSALLGLGALALFSPPSQVDARWWLAISLAVVFTGFSGLQIAYYSKGVSLADADGFSHARVAGFRESGILVGICAACIAPSALAMVFGGDMAFPAFAAIFAAILVVAVIRMHGRWETKANRPQSSTPVLSGGFKTLLRDGQVRRLLVIGLLNALPTGFTATLFLFFVEDRLQAPDHTGAALLLFFLSAGAAAPLWARLSGSIGAKRAMLIGMAGSVIAFLWAVTLGPGDWLAFYAIAVASGAALGADMILLPAMLSNRLAQQKLSSEHGFGLWGFVNKAALALAAGLALPLLDYQGYVPGASNPTAALDALSFAYAGIPCMLKVAATLLLLCSPMTEETHR